MVPEDGTQKDYYYYPDPRQRESHVGRGEFGAGTEKGSCVSSVAL